MDVKEYLKAKDKIKAYKIIGLFSIIAGIVFFAVVFTYFVSLVYLVLLLVYGVVFGVVLLITWYKLFKIKSKMPTLMEVAKRNRERRKRRDMYEWWKFIKK